MHIIVGGLIEKGGKYLLVQEAKEKCYGKWNLPAGHLDANETLMAGAEREIKEECGCDVEVTGVCQIGNQKSKGDNLVSIIFTTKLISDDFTIVAFVENKATNSLACLTSYCSSILLPGSYI